MHSQVSIVNTGRDITLNGDIGVTSSGPAIAGISPESSKNGIVHVNNAAASSAAADAAAACACAASSPLGTLQAANLGGQTFTPGNYHTAADATTDAGGIITLDGAGSYFFHIAGSFTTGADTQIVLTNGATACDVWWIVGDAASSAATTLGARTSMKGIICDYGAITAGADVVSTGSWFTLDSTPSISIDSGSFTSCTLDA